MTRPVCHDSASIGLIIEGIPLTVERSIDSRRIQREIKEDIIDIAKSLSLGEGLAGACVTGEGEADTSGGDSDDADIMQERSEDNTRGNCRNVHIHIHVDQIVRAAFVSEELFLWLLDAGRLPEHFGPFRSFTNFWDIKYVSQSSLVQSMNSPSFRSLRIF